MTAAGCKVKLEDARFVIYGGVSAVAEKITFEHFIVNKHPVQIFEDTVEEWLKLKTEYDAAAAKAKEAKEEAKVEAAKKAKEALDKKEPASQIDSTKPDAKPVANPETAAQ